MPRAKDQNIPPEFTQSYIRALSPTRQIAKNWGDRPDWHDLVQRRYTQHRVDILNPSAEQLARREGFRSAAACWDSASDLEKFAYLQIAEYEQSWPWPRYLHYTLNEFVEGARCEDIEHPFLCCAKADFPSGMGFVGYHSFLSGETDFVLNATVSPGAFSPLMVPNCNNCFAWAIRHFDEDQQLMITDHYQGWDPTGSDLYEIHDFFTILEPTQWNYQGWFYRSTTEITVAVLWDLTPWSGANPDTVYGFYDHDHPPQ